MGKKKKEIVYPVLGSGQGLIDTHCHLDMEAYSEDLDGVIERATRNGVGRIITVGIDLVSSREAIMLAEKYPGIRATVGVHPHNVGTMTDEDYIQLRQLAGHHEVVAFGEIGMDLHYDFAPVELQREHFSRQVALAKELQLPVVIHDREAHSEVMNVLVDHSPYPAGGVMHCFSGGPALAEEVLALGFHISIPGVITFKKSEEMAEVVRLVPLERIILETDGPYLAPEPRRGRRNEPALLLFTAQRVANLKDVTLDSIAEITTANAERLFYAVAPIPVGSVS
ncbi:MAG: TatD family hydrolase [Proteobacteria bacterium]|nr:TatD family hydrolase [Pseudomonadota bacterium]MBU1686646.1 TatD family hydrolase [Pseudomonadota bacterium]